MTSLYSTSLRVRGEVGDGIRDGDHPGLVLRLNDHAELVGQLLEELVVVHGVKAQVSGEGRRGSHLWRDEPALGQAVEGDLLELLEGLHHLGHPAENFCLRQVGSLGKRLRRLGHGSGDAGVAADKHRNPCCPS